jgi:hypothetical protein
LGLTDSVNVETIIKYFFFRENFADFLAISYGAKKNHVLFVKMGRAIIFL